MMHGLTVHCVNKCKTRSLFCNAHSQAASERLQEDMDVLQNKCEEAEMLCAAVQRDLARVEEERDRLRTEAAGW